MHSNAEKEKEKEPQRFLGTSNTMIHKIEYATIQIVFIFFIAKTKKKIYVIKLLK